MCVLDNMEGKECKMPLRENSGYTEDKFLAFWYNLQGVSDGNSMN